MGLTRLATLAVPQPCNSSFTIRLSINIQLGYPLPGSFLPCCWYKPTMHQVESNHALSELPPCNTPTIGGDLHKRR